MGISGHYMVFMQKDGSMKEFSIGLCFKEGSLADKKKLEAMNIYNEDSRLRIFRLEELDKVKPKDSQVKHDGDYPVLGGLDNPVFSSPT